MGQPGYWNCMACWLPSRDGVEANMGEASGGTGTVSLTLSQPRERGPAGEKIFMKRMKKEGALGVGAVLWQSQCFPRQTDRVLMHSESQSVFTGVSAGDKQFTTTSSIVFTI
uniref:Uncharacterized protein n=1 Tax=Cebus imitator TaxID=2715852 RepID=A0A2K5QVV0_CEBIM